MPDVPLSGATAESSCHQRGVPVPDEVPSSASMHNMFFKTEGQASGGVIPPRPRRPLARKNAGQRDPPGVDPASTTAPNCKTELPDAMPPASWSAAESDDELDKDDKEEREKANAAELSQLDDRIKEVKDVLSAGVFDAG